MRVRLAIGLVLLLVSAAALADDDEQVTMWTVEGAVGYSGYSTRSCELKPYSEEHAHKAKVPAGLRGQGKVVEHSCGLTYVRMELPGELAGKRWLFTTPDGVTTKQPRKTRWDKEPATGSSWVRDMNSSKHKLGIPLDRPDWEHLVRMRPGETFEVIDPDMAVIRTVAGRELLVTPFLLMDKDPLGGKLQRQASRQTWEEGRALRCTGRPITGIPPAAELLADKALEGAIFAFDLDTDDLSDERFVDAWLDPVGQRLERACDDRRRDDEPCGVYWLDYTALGAWWPTRDEDVLVTFDGTERLDGAKVPRLKVLVRKPWKSSGWVTPAWAGKEP